MSQASFGVALVEHDLHLVRAFGDLRRAHLVAQPGCALHVRDLDCISIPKGGKSSATSLAYDGAEAARNTLRAASLSGLTKHRAQGIVRVAATGICRGGIKPNTVGRTWRQ